MRTNTKKILGAVAVAGLVATGGTAFTAGGLSTEDATGGFVGGQASQDIVGATLLSSSYTVVANQITAVALSFGPETELDGKAVTISFDDGHDAAYTCEVVTAEYTSDCTAVTPVANTAASLSITVAS